MKIKEHIIDIFLFYLLMAGVGTAVGLAGSMAYLQYTENQERLLHLQGKLAAFAYEGDCVELGIPKYTEDHYGWGVLDGCTKRKTHERNNNRLDGGKV